MTWLPITHDYIIILPFVFAQENKQLNQHTKKRKAVKEGMKEERMNEINKETNIQDKKQKRKTENCLFQTYL